MKKTILIFTILSGIAKIIAFARELLLAYCFGTSTISDVYLVSMTLPITLFGFISSGITSGYIPIYSAIISKEGKAQGIKFTNRVLNTLSLVCIALVGIYYVFSRNIIELLASGFDAEATELAIKFTNISIWAIVLTCATTVFMAYLQVNNRIEITALVSVPLNMGIAISIIVAYSFNLLILLPVGYVLACFFQMIFMILCIRKEGFVYQLTLGINEEHVKSFYKAIGFLTIGSSAYQINLLIDRTLATTITIGGLSVFEYGSRINDLIMGMSITPICTALFPQMSQCAENLEVFKDKICEAVLFFIQIMIPISVVVMVFARQIVKLIYYRGAFDENSLQLTTGVVFYYGLGLLPFALRELFSKAFYALSDTKTPLYNASIGIVANVILNVILSKIMGLGGLALATSVSAIITVAMLMRALNKKIGGLKLRKYFKQIAVVLGLTIVGICLAYFMYNRIDKWLNSEIFAAGISAACFVLGYIFVLIKLKIIDLHLLKK